MGVMGQGGSHADDEEKAPLIDDKGSSTNTALAAGWLSGLKATVGLEAAPPPPPPGPLSRMTACFPAMSYRHRMTGFLVCLSFGLLLSLTSLTSVTEALLGNPTPFAIKYTGIDAHPLAPQSCFFHAQCSFSLCWRLSVGNLLSIGSYCFLVGPEKQCKGMFAPERKRSTIAFLGSLVATLICIFYLRHPAKNPSAPCTLRCMVRAYAHRSLRFLHLVCRSRLLTLVFLLAQIVAMVYYALSYIPFGHSLVQRFIF